MNSSEYKYWNIRNISAFYQGNTQMRIDIMKNVLPEAIYNDFLANIHHINKLYLFLTLCPRNLLSKIEPRLFHSCLESKDSPDDLSIATIWFTIGDELREQIIYNNQEALFWNIFVESQEIIKIIDSPIEKPILDNKEKEQVNQIEDNSREDFKQGNPLLSHDLDSQKNEQIIDSQNNYLVLSLDEDTNTDIIVFSEKFIESLRKKMIKINTFDKLDQIQDSIDSLFQKMNAFEQSNFSKEFLTLEETAKYLGVSEKTIYDYNFKGILNTYTINGKKKYYKKTDIMKQLESNKISSTREVQKKATQILTK